MKKFTLSVLAILITTGLAFGQLTKSDKADPDESKVPNSRMDQHEAFLDGEYQFPAKPRNMWTVGVEGGYNQISGDVNPDFGWDAGLNFRKALGYASSIRFGAIYAKPEGDDFNSSPSNLIHGSGKAARSGIPTGGQNWFYDHQFESEVIIPYAEFVLNLNNINFHREQNKWNFEISAGPAAYMFDTKTNFANIRNTASGNIGSVNGVHLGNSDDTREDAEIGDFQVIPAATFAGAVSYRAGDRLAISMRPRWTKTWDDWLDGEAYDDTGIGPDSNSDYSSDKDNNISLNLALDFALGSSDKKVQPLWWENPLKFSYDYLVDDYSFDPDYLFQDGDGDGVMDRFDKEPNSPCTFVDGAGVVIDSDKDGVADCVDACPFTAASQVDEINENGCAPEPIKPNYCELIKDCACCDKPPVTITPSVDPCASMSYPSVSFAAGSRRMSAGENTKVQTIAAQLGASPTCRIVVEGFGKGKEGIQRAWARAKAVTDALVDNYGIDRSRIITRYSGVDGYGDVVIVRSARAGEYGTSNPAPPAPGTY